MMWVATMNLNGDYISDTLAAQVGGLGTHYITAIPALRTNEIAPV